MDIRAESQMDNHNIANRTIAASNGKLLHRQWTIAASSMDNSGIANGHLRHRQWIIAESLRDNRGISDGKSRHCRRAASLQTSPMGGLADAVAMRHHRMAVTHTNDHPYGDRTYPCQRKIATTMPPRSAHLGVRATIHQIGDHNSPYGWQLGNCETADADTDTSGPALLGADLADSPGMYDRLVIAAPRGNQARGLETIRIHIQRTSRIPAVDRE